MAKNYFKNAPIAKTWRRSTFPISPAEMTNFTSFNLGDLVPLYKPIEVLAHDTFIFDLGSLIQMPDALIAPIMDGLKFSAYAFWVPKRLLWNKTKEFYGENDQAGPRSVEYTEPRVPLQAFSNDATGTRLSVGDFRDTIASHFSIPYCNLGLGSGVTNYTYVNVLPIRAYYLIWNWYFRDQNLQNSYIVNVDGNGDTNGITSSTANRPLISSTDPNDSTIDNFYGLSGKLLKAAKKHDYFTSMLPYDEKTATPVSLQLGDFAPVIAITNDAGTETGGAISDLTASLSTGTSALGSVKKGQLLGDATATQTNSFKTVADLRGITTTKIRTLQEAFALHHLYQVDAIGGTRYDEQIFAHFGSRPIAESYKPEELGEVHFDINVDQVVAHASSSNEDLGQRGAYSLTGNKNHLVTKSFTEPGYIIILGVARQTNHIYSQGLDPVFTKNRRFDYYYDAFKSIGLVPKNKREIMAQNTSDDNDVFGFGEYGVEYRHFTPMVSGLLNPNYTNSLDYWTLADKLPTNVSLSSKFIEEDPSNLTRALATGATTAQFVGRFGFRGKMTRVVPVYSIAKGIL